MVCFAMVCWASALTTRMMAASSSIHVLMFMGFGGKGGMRGLFRE